MATNSRIRPPQGGNMKRGICYNNEYLNPDNGEMGPCPMSGKIQSINVQRLSDFKCAQCGSRLTPVKDGPDWKKILMYTIPVVVIVGGVLAFLMNTDGSKLGPDPSPTITVTPSFTSDTIGKTIALKAKVTPIDSPVTWISSDNEIATVDNNGIVTLLKEGEVQITGKMNDTVTASSKITVIKKKNDGNSQPIPVFGGAATLSADGRTITFKRDYVLDLHTNEGDELYISKGDKIRGAKIENGRLISGEYFSVTGEERYLSGLNNKL